jgi:GxxExxY protein
MQLKKILLKADVNDCCNNSVEKHILYTHVNVGTRRADFVVENKVVVELKAVTNLEDVHLAQAKNYVVAYKFEKGLLINFGARSLQYKLIFNPNLNSQNY